MIACSRFHVALEWAILLLLLCVPLGSLILFGGVRLWMSGPFLLIVFIAGTLLLVIKIIRNEGFRVPVAWFGLLLLCGYGCYLVPGSVVPYEARLEFVKLCSYLVTYWAFCELITTRGRWRFVACLFLLVGSMLCWYAIIQAAKGSNMVLYTPRPSGYGMRASGTVICPNHFAHILELLLVFGITMVSLPSAGWGLRIFGAYAVVLTLPVLLLTESRSGWIGASIGVAVVILLQSLRKSIGRMVIALVSLALVFMLLAIALWYFSPTFQRRVNEGRHGNVRIQVWQDTIEMIKDQPVKGHGPGSYRWLYGKYKQAYSNPVVSPRYAHNEYLNFQAEYGVVGSVIAGGALLFFLARLLSQYRCVRSRRDAALIAGAVGCVAASAAHALFDFNMHLYSNASVLTLLAGMTSGSLFLSCERKIRPMSRSVLWIISLAGMASCVILAGVTLQMLKGYNLTEKAKHLRDRLDNEQALRFSEKACAIYPGYWKAHKEHANILKTQSFWNIDPEQKLEKARAAAEAYMRVIELNPLDTDTYVELSQVHGDLLGDADTSIKLLQQVIELRPQSFHFHAQLGLRFRRLNRLDEALSEFQRAHELNRRDEMVRLNIQSLKKKIKKRDVKSKPAV